MHKYSVLSIRMKDQFTKAVTLDEKQRIVDDFVKEMRLLGFSYFILKGKFNDEDFRLEYKDMLFDTIDKDSDNMFTGETCYRNMLKLYDVWKEK
ncbi:MAG: hypothetical protein FWF38_01825 [Spirochaetaceae bacterium]|nr:hypothetical protein [Spirochaetaceae bacterium]